MHEKLRSYIDYLNTIFLGKEETIRLALCCIFAKGHLLLEDIPGVGKTTLILLLAKTMGIPLKRIQLTSDLLPADIVGNLIFNHKTNSFDVFKGPIFANFILADELNRATPKTQSAFLQAMEEESVSIDDTVYPLPSPFIVCATQNPQQLIGTFRLPESQLDRFMMKLKIGFPEEEWEKKLLLGARRRDLIQHAQIWFSLDQLAQMQEEATHIYVSASVVDYVEAILQKSRQHSPHPVSFHEDRILGLSPRAGIAMIDAAKSFAYLEGRDKVLPGDVQKTCPYVIIHRMFPDNRLSYELLYSQIHKMIEEIPLN